MEIAVIGTGMVGQTIAGKLEQLGHDVLMGTRDPAATAARTEPTAQGAPGVGAWIGEHPGVTLTTLVNAAAQGEVVFLATNGMGTVEAVTSAGADNLAGKLVIDISNPLDFSAGFPPTLAVCNTDSLGEQVQAAAPDAHVVKTLNTVNASLMVDPGQLADGEHDIFLCGNDADSKTEATDILTDWFGWKHVHDLGDISNARGTEQYLPLWVRMYGALGTPNFNVRVVQGD